MAKDNKSPIGKTEDENPSVYSPTSSNYWLTEFSDSFWLDMYSREGIAAKATDKYIGDLTSPNYKTNNTLFEKIRKTLQFDEKINYAAERAFLLGECLIFLGFNDPGEYYEPYEGKQVPDFIKVVPKTWVKLNNSNHMNITDDDCYELYDSNGTNVFKVHKSRFIHVHLRRDLDSSLLSAYRPLEVCDNILWSTGQAFFRGAAGLTHITVKDPKTINRIKNGKPINEVEALKQEGTFKNINSETVFISDDRYNVDLKGVQGTALDPVQYWTVAVQAAAVPLKVPWQMLIGSNAGSITGSETNQKDYYAEVGVEREKFMTKYIHEFCDRFGINRPEIEFETLFEETDTEKAGMLEKDTKSMVNAYESGLISQTSAIEYLNEEYNFDFQAGKGSPLAQKTIANTTSVTTTKGDVKDAEKPKKLPQLGSTWEKSKYQNHIETTNSNLQDIFNNNLSFDNLKKSMKGSIFFDRYAEDAEKEAKLVVDQQVSAMDTALKVYITDRLTKSWEVGLAKASEDIMKDLIVNERQKQIRKAMTDSVMDSVTGATDDMKKDLRRVLHESLNNEESPSKAAKKFKNYVSVDFADKYKNRLKIIAEQETMDVFNEASYQGYRDSGVVEKLQWITALDSRVRPEHARVHGEVVNFGEQFSLGVKRAPHGVGCRCDTVPYFDD